jgi:hypothetical protein
MTVAIIAIIGALLTTYILFKKKNQIKLSERSVLFSVGLSFLIFFSISLNISTYLYIIYTVILCLSVLGVVALEANTLSNRKFMPLLVALIWFISALISLLNLQYHFEMLSVKIFITIPLSIFVLVKRKSYSAFTSFWLMLYLLNLILEICNSYLY